MDDIRDRALTWQPGTPLLPEMVYATPKSAAGNGQKYRVIADYSLEDNLISNRVSAYFRDLLEGAFEPSVLAFRGPRAAWGCDFSQPRDAAYFPLGRPESLPSSHHDAPLIIEAFRAKHHGSCQLFAAECDIQGFFDSVEHSTVRAALHALLTTLHTPADPRALEVLNSFLGGYSYYGTAREAALAELAKRGIGTPVLPKPSQAKRECNIPEPYGTTGLPQGSAISCVLANVVLAKADSAVLATLARSPGHSLYLRYCDDIIVLSTSVLACRSAMQVYRTSLITVRLPFHPFKTFTSYSRSFWRGKSKNPYRWGSSTGGMIPWLSFVGYQTHHGGRVRVRRSSIRNEIAKQRSIVRDAARHLATRIAKARVAGTLPLTVRPLRATLGSAEQHLLSIGVGYPDAGVPAPRARSVSWCHGFEALSALVVDVEWLKELDAGRKAALAELAHRLRGHQRRGEIQFSLPVARTSAAPAGEVRRFICEDGPPFSYAQYFGL